jgi:hypothetical protein
LQDLDLSLNLLLLDGLQDLDDAFLIVGDIDSLEDFRILPSPYTGALCRSVKWALLARR